MINESDIKKEGSKNKLSIKTNKKLGYVLNIVIFLIGAYFHLQGEITYAISLGDSGSITISLLKSFSINSGRSLIYLSIYGLILTLVSKKDSLKEFYTYYMIAVIFLTIGSLIYFII